MVVGRWGVDTGIMIHAHDSKINIVDITEVFSYHQGQDASSSKKHSVQEKDWKWNYQYFDRKFILTKGTVHSNYYISKY